MNIEEVNLDATNGNEFADLVESIENSSYVQAAVQTALSEIAQGETLSYVIQMAYITGVMCGRLWIKQEMKATAQSN